MLSLSSWVYCSLKMVFRYRLYYRRGQVIGYCVLLADISKGLDIDYYRRVYYRRVYATSKYKLPTRNRTQSACPVHLLHTVHCPCMCLMCLSNPCIRMSTSTLFWHCVPKTLWKRTNLFTKNKVVYILCTKWHLKEDNLSTKDKMQGPEHVQFIIQRFHCSGRLCGFHRGVARNWW